MLTHFPQMTLHTYTGILQGSSSPYGVHLMSVKQIGVFRKEIRDVRGETATNDAL